jgi:hypothetical protein
MSSCRQRRWLTLQLRDLDWLDSGGWHSGIPVLRTDPFQKPAIRAVFPPAAVATIGLAIVPAAKRVARGQIDHLEVAPGARAVARAWEGAIGGPGSATSSEIASDDNVTHAALGRRPIGRIIDVAPHEGPAPPWQDPSPGVANASSMPERRYWVMRTDVNAREQLLAALDRGELRQGWGYDERLDLNRIARKLADHGWRVGALDDEERSAWRGNQRMWPGHHGRISVGDLIVVPKMPRDRHWMIVEVVGDYRFDLRGTRLWAIRGRVEVITLRTQLQMALGLLPRNLAEPALVVDGRRTADAVLEVSRGTVAAEARRVRRFHSTQWP